MLPFCIIVPADYNTTLNKPAIELALTEVAAVRGMKANVLYIYSEFNLHTWQYSPDWMLALLNLPKPYMCIVAGVMQSLSSYYYQNPWVYAAAWYSSSQNFAIAGGETFWALNWGDDNIMPREYPYWGVRLNRKAQMGLIDHELEHLFCHCPEAGHRPGDIPWERRF